ncbi:uncharacterized protein N0V89_011701 [Didymosphaeria variabile]|uniref:Heterokaryon incompatibility domain-containing protein n=1 Tax=Didymosphaeria variabile TaxID=1932322 RepID=A0A9W8XBS7_9PLEO|nr:uncharacterized protein N0V89_011701 [Didymosphaeria variabile]KAJ4345568.1 hypothetical protein N0V89_011701 [Didymosphaeria variabile]
MDPISYPTTYEYDALPTPHHIRLLHIHTDGSDDDTTFEIVIIKLPTDSEPFAFETLSYTWGAPRRVASLSLHNNSGVIGLTQNLSQAIPHLVRTSQTRYLWIDQLCINQNDPGEKAQQVSIMDKIYKAGSRVIVWLGPADEHTTIIKEWLHELEQCLASREDAHKTLPTHKAYNHSVRMLVVRSTWVSTETDPKYAIAARRFWSRRWFRRSWVVQELLLSRAVIFLAGSYTFTMQDLSDLQTLPPNMALPPVMSDEDKDNTKAYDTLMSLKRFPFTDRQPLRFLKFMAQVASEFETTELVDRLCAFLGMLEGTSFRPDYTRTISYNFTAFVVSVAQTYGSIDFLSLWSANIDAKIESTPDELKGFASWVPSWTWLPLMAPFRLVAGTTRAFFSNVKWDAAAGRKHAHQQNEDAVETERLHVRGEIIDRVARISSAKIDRYFGDADDAYLEGIAAQIKSDLPDSGFGVWTRVDLVRFLNIISANGATPKESAEEVLGLKKKEWSTGLVDNLGYNESLSSRLSIGRGRRFATTERGRMGLVPFIGTRAQSGEEKGSAIAVLHGCIVPVVLESVSEERDEWTVIGDCYLEGCMHGEAVEWTEDEADTFVLV